MTHDRLLLVQLLSPAFPVGTYAYSQGLEQAIVDGVVGDAASLRLWIDAILRFGAGRSDAILVAHARQPESDLGALADLALAHAASSERATELREQGTAFGEVIARITGEPCSTRPYPVAFGAATRRLDLPTPEILAHWLHAVAAQLVSAAVRFVPLGGGDGQTVLASLGPAIGEMARDYSDLPLSALSSATPRADLAAMRHETLEVRIFRS